MIQELDIEKIQQQTFIRKNACIDEEAAEERKDRKELIEETSRRIREASYVGDFSIVKTCPKKYLKGFLKWIEDSGFYVVVEKLVFSCSAEVYISWDPKDCKKIGIYESWLHKWWRHNNYFSVANFFFIVLMTIAALFALLLITASVYSIYECVFLH